MKNKIYILFIICNIIIIVTFFLYNHAAEMEKATILSSVDPQILKKETTIKNWAVKNLELEKIATEVIPQRKIVVAIIDTGIDINHPDFKDNLWVNPNEIPDNGTDDDGNGYIDDVNGWNFVSQNPDLKDNHGHGSHIAGIIGFNNIKLTKEGVAPNIQLMILKYFDPKKPIPDNLKLLTKAIDYAVKMKAHIINFSGGGLLKSKYEEMAIQRANENGILFVAAAGNEKSNSDLRGFYPASYDLENIVSVGAIDEENEVIESSNYGQYSVDIAAPGSEIYSAMPGGGYGFMSGTSQATAFVTGVAALMMAQNEQFKDAKLIKKYLLETGTKLLTLKGKVQSEQKLNAYRALNMKSQSMSADGELVQINKMDIGFYDVTAALPDLN